MLGFATRRATSKMGLFLAEDDIAKRGATYATDLVRAVPGLYLTYPTHVGQARQIISARRAILASSKSRTATFLRLSETAAKAA